MRPPSSAYLFGLDYVGKNQIISPDMIQGKYGTHWGLFLFLLLAGTMLYLLNRHTPMIFDDYWYNYTIGKKDGGDVGFSSERISGFKDLISSLYYYRYPKEGRLANMFVILVEYCGGKGLFNIVNTGFMLGFLLAASKLCLQRLSLAGVCCAALLSLLLFPSTLCPFLWMSGSCNYLWGAFFLCLFLCLLPAFTKGGPIGTGKWVAGILCAFLCGSIHEGLGATLLGALVLYAAAGMAAQKKVSGSYISLAFITFIGLAACLASPGLWDRVGNASAPLTTEGLVKKAVLLAGYTYLPSCLLVVIVWVQRKKLLDSFYPFLVLPNLVLALSYGEGGVVGNGYFYYCLSIMLWAFSLLRDFINRYSFRVAALLAPATLAVWGWGIVHYGDIEKRYHEIVERGKTEPIVSAGYFDSHRSVPRALRFSLPLGNEQNDAPLYHYVGPFHGQQPFFVVYNTYIRDKSVYHLFQGEPPDKMVAKACGDLTLVRLPYGYYVPAYRKVVSMQDASLPPLEMALDDNLPLIVKACYHIIGKRYSSYGRDYHEGFHYLILPAPANQYARVSVMMKKEGATEATYASAELPRPPAPAADE